MVVGAVALSALVVGAWFPASALYHQHQQLASGSAQLLQLRHQDAALAQERKSLANPAEVARIARQQYELVTPGQQAYEVLPASQAGANATTADPGDPGLTAPVTPSGDSELPAGTKHNASSTATTATGTSTTHATASASGSGQAAKNSSGSTSVVGRILQTLEFWR